MVLRLSPDQDTLYRNSWTAIYLYCGSATEQHSKFVAPQFSNIRETQATLSNDCCETLERRWREFVSELFREGYRTGAQCWTSRPNRT